MRSVEIFDLATSLRDRGWPCDVGLPTVWPGEVIDLSQGPHDLDPGDPSRWLFVGGRGSRLADADMERFIATVEPDALRAKLREAINGKHPFKGFLAVLQRHDQQFTSWHRHRDDARIGHACWTVGFTSGSLAW